MMRSGSSRVFAVFCMLVLGVFAFGVDTASATHFRYGSARWEKVLTHNVPGEYKFRVTFEGGWRWSYPFGGSVANQCASIPGFVASGTTGVGSCLPVGSIVNLGSIVAQTASGTPVAVKFNNATTSTTLAYNGTIASILVNQDQMFTTFTFEVTVPVSTGPVTLVYTSNARLSQLLDNNNDQPWRVAVTVNGDPAFGTRSPRSVSLPTIPVTVGINNTFSLPNVAYDNFVNKFRLSTTAESSLISPQPLSPSVFSLDADTGVISFQPRTAGLYAVQFHIVSYDQGGVARGSIPVDLTFQAIAPSVGAPAAVLSGPSVVSFPPGQSTSFQLQAAIVPVTSGWTGTIVATPLPTVPAIGQPGAATFTVPAAGASTAPITGTVAWTPTLASGSDVMCFQAIYRNTTSGAIIVSPGQKCVSMELGELATNLSSVTVAGSLYVGQHPTVSATLKRTIDNQNLVQRTVNFTVTAPGGGTATYAAVTSVAGVATAPIDLPKTGAYTVRANFAGVDGELLASASSDAAFSVLKATGALFPSAPVATNPSIGFPSQLSVQMNVQPGNLPAPAGQLVDFHVTPAGGSETVVQGVTDALGIATAFYAPQTGGQHTVYARFEDSADVTGPAQSGTSIFTPRQRIQLSLSVGSAVAGVAVPLTVTATLIPQGTPLASRLVALSFTGPSVGAPANVTTGANGIATTSVTFSTGGTYTVTATAPMASPSEANHLGEYAIESTTVTVAAAKVATALSALANVPNSMPLNTTLTASTTLSRTTAPAGALGGALITFTLTRPNATTVTQTASTLGDGSATTLFAAANFTIAGAYQLSASYAGSTLWDAAQSPTTSFFASNLPLTAVSLSPIDAVVGVSKTVTATLVTLPLPGTPIAGATVTLSGTTGSSANATTNAAGVATFVMSYGAVGQFTATASFAGIAGVNTPSNVTVPLTVSKAAMALTAPVTTPAPAQVGVPLIGGTTLSYATLPLGVPAGRLIIFTMTDPGGTIQNPAVNTVAGGAASASFSTFVRGAHLLKADYAGSTAELAVTSPTASINVYERTTLSLPAASGASGSALTFSATLRTSPANLPVAGQTVTFDFGGVIPAQTATTDANGVATTTATFANAGTFPVTASFFNLAAFFLNNAGAQAATTATANATVTASATALAPVTVPATVSVGDAAIASTTLTRAGGIPVSGATVTFTFAGASSATLSATTNAAGLATVTVPMNIKGAYTVAAAFAAAPGLLASATGQAAFTVLQQTQLAVPGITGTAGAPVTVSATLVSTVSGTPISGQQVSFSFAGAATPQTVVTGANGVASVQVVFPNAGNYTAFASFTNAAAFFGASSANASIDIGSATSALTPLTVANAALVGTSLNVSTVLQRTSAPAGAIGNSPVTFTLSGPASAVLTTQTDANGFASVSFPLNARGAYTVTAEYTGTGGMAASVSNTAFVNVYQRTQLQLGNATGVVDQQVPLTAVLTSVPGNQALSGQPVTVAVVSGPTQTSTTDGNGVAPITVTLPTSGTFGATGSFLDAAGFFTDAAGSIPPVPTTAASSVTINTAPTTLSPLTVPATRFVGDSLSVTTVLTRTAAPAGPVTGALVVFTLTGGPSPIVVPSTTDANGAATATFPLTAKGPFSVTASYAGSPTLSAASLAPASFSVYQRVALTMNPSAGVASDPTGVSAQLLTVPGGAPVAGETVTFDFAGVVASGSAVTAADGQSTLTRTFALPGTYPVTASFVNAAGYFANAAGDIAAATVLENVSVSAVSVVLDTLTVPASSIVGQSISAATVLRRTTAPGGPLAGYPVIFTLTGPQSMTLTANTNGTGAASVSFPSNSTPGVYTVTASFAGSGAVTATTSNIASVTVYQPTQLTLASASAVAGEPASLSATLIAVPSGAFVAGQVVTFAVDGLPSQTATTNANGVATISVTAATSGTFNATASFSNAAAFFTNAAGALPPVATTAAGTVTVTKATTQLSLTAPPQVLVGNTLAASATLTRNGSTPTAGQLVAFTFTNGTSTVTQSATTNGAGVASVTFPLTQRGAYTVTAQFAGSAALDAASSSVVPVTVYQRAQLTLATAPGIAGSAVGVSATLTSIPAGSPIAGQTIQFAFPSIGFSASAVTDANGAATTSATFATAGSFPAAATFLNLADFYVDANGALIASAADASVTVSDSTPPVVTSAVNGTLGLNGWYIGDVTVAWTVSDAESAIASQTGCGPQTVSANGTVSFTCEVTSGGGTTTESVTVQRDVTAPVITVPATQTIEATTATGALGTYPAATAVDPTSGLAQLTCTPTAGTQFALGDTAVTCTAADEAGNQSSATFTVSVVDTTAPAIDAVANISTPATSPSGAVVTFTSPASHDLVSGDAIASCLPASGTTFTLGTTTVTCTVADARGNTGTRTFDVAVTNNAPTFTPPANISRAATSPAGAVVTFTAIGQDVEDGAPLAVCSPVSGSTFALGTATVSCTVTDVAGATATGSFTVTVTNVAPTVTVPAAPVSTSATSPAGALVVYTATAGDFEDGTPLVPTCMPASGTTFALGTTPVSCSITDVAGATTTATFNVIVTNNAPTFTPRPNITTVATSAAGAVVNFTAVGQDVEDGALNAVCTPVSGTTFPIGTTPVSCVVRDVAGATAAGAFTVTVTNNAPTFTPPANIVTEATGPTSAIVTFTAIGNDLEQGAIPAVCLPLSGSAFTVGTTTVSCTVTDVAGAAAAGSFTVTVKAANTSAFLVRHAPVINGGTTVQGSVRVMLPENVTFNGGTVTGDLRIPGVPQVTRNGQTTLGSIVDGTGAATPTSHRLTLNGGASLFRLVRRTDGFVFATVAAPAMPAGTRNVSLNNSNDQIGSWATLRDLTLNGNIGSVAVAGGTYGTFTANGNNKLVLGVAGSTTPTVYNFQSLVLNGNSSIEVVGPVVVTVKNALSLNGSIGNAANPEWLTLKIATGGLTMNGNIAVRGFIEAPAGNVTVNGASTLTGRVIADSLTLNGSAKLTLVQ